jgi:lipopolysaccharide export system permease protein
MKTLDRYIAKNFLNGYFIALGVMVGMFLAVDLFLNLDEFAEQSDVGVVPMLVNIAQFYSVRSVLWFRDLGGMVIVIAAVFSLARMTRNNELIAIMASGVSLKRILAPILFLALLLTGLLAADQEFLIPRLSGELTRKQDQLPNEAAYDLWFLGDANGSLVCCQRYEEKEQTMHHPLVILREREDADTWRVVGRIQALRATYDIERKGWVLEEGVKLRVPTSGLAELDVTDDEAVDFYATNLSPRELPLRRREGFKSLLSLRQLTEMERDPGTRSTELADIALQKHSRITAPIINLIMLMVALPVLVCRDPRDMKTAILVSFLTTGACFVVSFLCSLYATEVFFGQVRPAFFSWLPIFIFFPIALVQIDAMRT